MAEDTEQAANADGNRLVHSLFRRPEKYKIGDDFDLFVKKSELYFEAVELTDEKKRRFALLFNLSEDAFRLAESVAFTEGENAYKNWTERLKLLFERNQTATEKRYNFHQRVQHLGESVNSYALALREAGAKCGFRGDEYASRLVDQFILGLNDRTTQTKLLQDPPSNLDDALKIARRFEAANATMQTLAGQGSGKYSRGIIGAVGSLPTPVTCYACGGFEHISKQCPTMNSSPQNNPKSTKVCYNCQKAGHLARNCFKSKERESNVPNAEYKDLPNRQPFSCFNCGKQGHIAKFCRSKVEGNTKKDDQNQDQNLSKTQSQDRVKESKIRLSTISPASKRKTLMVEAQINGKSKLVYC